LAANRFGGGSRRVTTTTIGVVPDSVLSVGLSRPTDVLLSDVTADSVSVRWRGDDDPAIKYTIDVMHGSEIVKTVDVDQSPAVVSELMIDGWIPCVVVSAVQSQTDVVASADPVCADSPPPTTVNLVTP
jgi:hypothetical protein